LKKRLERKPPNQPSRYFRLDLDTYAKAPAIATIATTTPPINAYVPVEFDADVVTVPTAVVVTTAVVVVIIEVGVPPWDELVVGGVDTTGVNAANIDVLNLSGCSEIKLGGVGHPVKCAVL